MKRITSRIIAMFIIYNYNITKGLDINGILNIIDDDIDYDKKFTSELVTGIVEHQRELDHRLSLNLHNYTLDRLSIVDRSLLEIGAYELIYTTTATEIIINEVIEISKEYSEIDGFLTSKFNNSVLDSLAREIRHGK